MDKFVVIDNPEEELWKEIAETITRTQGTAVAVPDYKCWKEGFGDGLTLRVLKEKATDDFVCSLAIVTYCPSQPKLQPITAVGMFYTTEKYRGKGYGTEVFKNLISKEDLQGHNLTLIAEDYMAPKYSARFGFSYEPSFRWEGYYNNSSDLHPDLLEDHPEVKVVPYEEDHFEKVNYYDKTIAPDIDRSDYLLASLRIPESWTMISMDSNGEVTGVIRGRNCVQDQLYIGPFYADSPIIAEALLKSFLLSSPRPLTSFTRTLISAPSTNKDFVALWNKLTRSAKRSGGPMPAQFTNVPPKIPVNRLYGLFEYSMSYV